MRIPLLLLVNSRKGPAVMPDWPLGPVWVTPADPAALAAKLLTKLAVEQDAAAWLLWDARLPLPAPQTVEALLTTSPAEVLHAGLALGTGGMPGMLDFVAPAWMLQRDPDAALAEVTSWRVSLRACLVRNELWHALGLPDETFDSLDGAGLELGLRWIRRGARCRHVPALLALPSTETAHDAGQQQRRFPIQLPLADELRVVERQWGRRWLRWAAWRGRRTRYATKRELRRARRELRSDDATPSQPLPPPPQPDAFFLPDSAETLTRSNNNDTLDEQHGRVTVLIPTIERYPYLRVVLDQLRTQTVPPHEILVVDQTPAALREPGLAEEFADLPVRWLTLDESGQCVSRNAGLARASGTHILFLDDDDEIEPELIAQHLAHLAATGADASCGVADELGAGPLPAEFCLSRVSDVFPTNNAMLKREALRRSGLFDLAYNRGARADGDLGMRLYLAGCALHLAPQIRVLHHHAPRGGLRTHNARRITYASSRSHILHRHLPSVTQLYYHLRYFTPRQVHEAQVIAALGTLVGRGSRWQRVAKALVGAALLPHTWWVIGRRLRKARALFATYPQVPTLPAGDTRSHSDEVANQDDARSAKHPTATQTAE